MVSGKVITKGPKEGRLFLLPFSNLRTLPFACSIVNNQSEVWHKRLVQTNSKILSHLFQHGFHENKYKTYELVLSINCASCILGKSKTLPFNGNCTEVPSRRGCGDGKFPNFQSDLSQIWSHSQCLSFQV